jgi:hypothetical protein
VSITSRQNLNERQTLNMEQEQVNALRVSTQANKISEKSARNQASLQQSHGRDLEEQQHAPRTREQAPSVDQASTDHQAAIAKTPSSGQRDGEKGRVV